jgi:hypothetical protein
MLFNEVVDDGCSLKCPVQYIKNRMTSELEYKVQLESTIVQEIWIIGCSPS